MRQRVSEVCESRWVIVAMVGLFVGILSAVMLVGCSNGPTVGSSSTDDYTVEEYNRDVDNLERILNNARSLYHEIEAMGNPNSFTTQSQVDRYNNLVDRYNTAAKQYGEAVKEFNKKYAANADGDGTRGTDPDNIQLPQRK